MQHQSRRIAVMLAGAAAFLDLYAPQSILPQLASAFDVNAHSVGWVITVTTLAVALVAPFAGALADAMGRKRVIAFASLALALPTLACSFAVSFPQLLLFRGIEGLLMPLIFCVTVAYISEEWPTEDARATTALYMAGAVAGGFLGRFFTGVVTDLADWRVAFAALAGLNLLLGLVLCLVMPRERAFQPSAGLGASLSAMRAHLGDPRLFAACAVGFAILFAQVGLFTFANLLLAAPPFGFGPAVLGTISAIYLVGMVTTPVLGRRLRRFPEQRPLSLGAGMFVAGVSLTLLPSLSAIIGGLALASAGTFLSQSAATNFVAQRAPRARSAAIGLYTTWYYIGGSAGAVVPGALWLTAGWPGVVGLIGAASLGAALVAVVFWREPDRGCPLPAANGADVCA